MSISFLSIMLFCDISKREKMIRKRRIGTTINRWKGKKAEREKERERRDEKETVASYPFHFSTMETPLHTG